MIYALKYKHKKYYEVLIHGKYNQRKMGQY